MSTPLIARLTWKVAEEPAGPYRSFHTRGWPHAYYKGVDGMPAAYIACEDAYTAKRARGEQPHGELTVYIAKWMTSTDGKLSFTWKRAKKRCATLQEAKDHVSFLINKYDLSPVNK